jgi:hypothetical protein
LTHLARLVVVIPLGLGGAEHADERLNTVLQIAVRALLELAVLRLLRLQTQSSGETGMSDDVIYTVHRCGQTGT